MQCPQISDEKKTSFASLTNNFWSFKKRIEKNIHQWGQTCFFFIRNLRALHLLFAATYIRIWGHLYSAGIALQLYSALRFERPKRVQKSRAIPWDFWDEVFSLSMPSVCPHLTTVCITVTWQYITWQSIFWNRVKSHRLYSSWTFLKDSFFHNLISIPHYSYTIIFLDLV